MNRFNYVIEKINSAPIRKHPFSHVYIENLFSKEDFAEIVGSHEIAIRETNSDKELFEELDSNGYKVISFPGCITNIAEYCHWHKNKSVDVRAGSTNEGFGIVLRLVDIKTKILAEVQEFMLSDAFTECIAAKLNLQLQEFTVDNGIQKYLDGYEISPHPDIRRKAATFMVNINNHERSEDNDHHTHYLHFRESRAYVQQFWKGNPDVDRCWVPWDWCESKFQQKENNSMVLFSPSDDTMHAVKANYDHLPSQRTQLYGNIWHAPKGLLRVEHNGLDIVRNSETREKTEPKPTLTDTAKSFLPRPIKSKIKKLITRTAVANEVHKRNT